MSEAGTLPYIARLEARGLCANGLAKGAICQQRAAEGRNPLRLCARCLAEYRTLIKAPRAPSGKPRVSSTYGEPPGGVPVLGWDFTVGPGNDAQEQPEALAEAAE